MNLLTVNFETVGNSESKASLNDVMDVQRLTPFDWDAFEAKDYVDTFDFSIGSWGPSYIVVDDGEGNLVFGDQDTLDPLDPEVECGASLWLNHIGEDIADFTFAGQVGSGTKVLTLYGGVMNLCGNPFPTELNLNDSTQVVVTGATPFDWDAFEQRDYVDTWDFNTCTWGVSYCFCDGAWCDADSLELVETTAIQPGAGFWYFATEDGVSIEFKPHN